MKKSKTNSGSLSFDVEVWLTSQDKANFSSWPNQEKFPIQQLRLQITKWPYLGFWAINVKSKNTLFSSSFKV